MGGVALATYVNKHAPPGRKSQDQTAPWHGTKVLELGSGTGVVGIAAALEGADVLLTDKDNLMPLMAKNIRLNKDSILTGSADYEAFDWAAPPPEEVSSKKWDVVLCAEAVATSSDVPLFASALASLLGPDGAAASGTAIYAHNPEDLQPLELNMRLRSAFESHGLSCESLPRPSWRLSELAKVEGLGEVELLMLQSDSARPRQPHTQASARGVDDQHEYAEAPPESK